MGKMWQEEYLRMEAQCRSLQACLEERELENASILQDLQRAQESNTHQEEHIQLEAECCTLRTRLELSEIEKTSFLQDLQRAQICQEEHFQMEAECRSLQARLEVSETENTTIFQEFEALQMQLASITSLMRELPKTEDRCAEIEGHRDALEVQCHRLMAATKAEEVDVVADFVQVPEAHIGSHANEQ